MSLKTRLAKLESVAKIENKDMCIFITCAYPDGEIEPPIIGYRSNKVTCMRLENESDQDLKKRVQIAALDAVQRQDCGLKVAIIFEIYENDEFKNTIEKH